MAHVSVYFVDSVSNTAKTGLKIVREFAQFARVPLEDVIMEDDILHNLTYEGEDFNKARVYQTFRTNLLIVTTDEGVCRGLSKHVNELLKSVNRDLDDEDPRARDKAVETSKFIEKSLKWAFEPYVVYESDPTQDYATSIRKNLIFQMDSNIISRASLALHLME